jgi:uncharacterized protein
VSDVAVFDTNVLLSAVGWKGTPYQCVQLARSGTVIGLTCREILDELAEKLASKLRFSDEEVAATLADLLAFLRLVVITGILHAVPDDPDDDKIVECGVLGRATHIVTGDRRHLLPLGGFQGIAIVPPVDFLKRHTPRT